MKRALSAAAAASLTLGGLGAAALFTSSTPAGAAGETVTITLQLALPQRCADGPMVFQVTDVPLVDGPELTGDPSEIVSNPCDWGGAASVDVDATTRQVTVAQVGGAAVFQTAEVTVEFSGMSGVTTVSDDLWDTDPETGCSMAPVSVTDLPGATGFDAAWAMNSQCGENDTVLMAVGGSSVFAWELVAPTTTTAAPTTTTKAPAVASAAAVTPAFTG